LFEVLITPAFPLYFLAVPESLHVIK